MCACVCQPEDVRWTASERLYLHSKTKTTEGEGHPSGSLPIDAHAHQHTDTQAVERFPTEETDVSVAAIERVTAATGDIKLDDLRTAPTSTESPHGEA